MLALSVCICKTRAVFRERETISRRCFTTFCTALQHSAQWRKALQPCAQWRKAALCTVEKRNVKNKRSTWESFVQFFLGLSGKPKEVLRPVLKLFIHFSPIPPSTEREYIWRDFFEFFLTNMISNFQGPFPRWRSLPTKSLIIPHSPPESCS